MALTTVKSIEEALSLVDDKKRSLKKAFEELESRTSLNFAWTDLEAHFSGVQSDLLHKFSALQALEASQTPKPNRERRKAPFSPKHVPARLQLKALSEKMDGLGLREYIIAHSNERTTIRAELTYGFKHAPDAGSMVLDALAGFWDENLGSGSRLRTACVLLLEELTRAGVEIGADVRERAKTVAAEWKANMAELIGGEVDEEGKEDWGLERVGYLQLLASYKLLSDGGFDASELVDVVVYSARCRQTVALCRVLGLESIIPDVVRRLVSKGKQLIALKFVFEFELTDEFPPVPLLKAYMMDSKNFIQKVPMGGEGSWRSPITDAKNEIRALKSVIKCIKDHDLESQYLRDEMWARIKKLRKEKAHSKRPAAAPLPKFQQPAKIPKHNGSKRRKAAAGPSAYNRKPQGNSFIRSSQQSSVNRAGLFPNHAPPHFSSTSGAYGMAGSLVAAAPYVGPTADVYGLTGAPLGFSGNLNPSTSNSYTFEIHAQPVHYSSASGYGGYDASSQYQPVYYPQ